MPTGRCCRLELRRVWGRQRDIVKDLADGSRACAPVVHWGMKEMGTAACSHELKGGQSQVDEHNSMPQVRFRPPLPNSSTPGAEWGKRLVLLTIVRLVACPYAELHLLRHQKNLQWLA